MIDRAQQLRVWIQRLSMDYTRTRASLAAGGMAYFVALSLAPMALAFGTLAGLVLDPADVRQVLERVAERALGGSTSVQPVVDALGSTIESASAGAFTVTALVSLVIAVYAASKVVYGMRQALNAVFAVTETRSGVVERAVSAVATLIGLVVAVALVVLLTIVPRVLEWLGIADTRLTSGSWVVDWAVSIALILVIVRATLRHGSSERQPVGWLSRGAWIGTLGIVASTVGVGLYARFSTSLSAAVLVFGTAIVILLWLYLCFLSVLVGAIVEADEVRTRTTSGARPPGP